MNNSKRIANTMVQWVYVTTLCHLLFILSASSSRQCEAQEILEERSPLYESRRNYHALVSEIDQRQSALSYDPTVYNDHKLTLSSTDSPHNSLDHQQYRLSPTPSEKPKSYAFAYAVRDGEKGGDDFSHKERREGKVTIGEYSVVLPDGRTQVVRYTSDSKRGFNADVTYEGEEKGKQSLNYQSSPGKKSPLYQVVSSIPPTLGQIGTVYNGEDYRKYKPTPSHKPRLLSSPSSTTKTSGPIFLSYPLKAQRPSLSPSIIYQSEGFRSGNNNVEDVTPSPQLYTLIRNNDPNPYPSPTPSTISYSQDPGPTVSSYRKLKSSSPLPLKYYASTSPNSLYGNSGRPVKFSASITRKPVKAIPPIPTIAFRPVPTKGYLNIQGGGIVPEGPTSPYRQIPRGQRAGPDTNVPIYQVAKSRPIYINKGSYASPSEDKYQQHGQQNDNYQQIGQQNVKYQQIGQQNVKYQQNSQGNGQRHHDDVTFSQSHHQPKSGIKSKSSLVPIEFFKAGPATNSPTVLQSSSLQSEQSVRTSYTPSPPLQATFSPVSRSSQSSYFINNNQIGGESSIPQGQQIYFEEEPQKIQFSPVKSSVATYTKGYLGGTPRPSIFESTSSPGIPVGRAIQPSVGGLVYIDPPNLGPRPRSNQHQGVKEALSRLPSVSPLPGQTTTHPYEAGRPDFGQSVSYSDKKDQGIGSSRHGKDVLVQQNLSSNQLSHSSQPEEHFHPRDGIIREYLVEKNYGNVHGYEGELV